MTMSELGFYRIANSEPDQLALVEPSEKTWTRGELLAKANQLTHALRALGVSKGDAVATVLPNSVDYYVSYLACAQAGFYMVPINWHLAGPEIAYILEDSGAKAFIASGSVPAMEEACLKAVSAINFPTSGCVSTTPIEGFTSLDNFLADFLPIYVSKSEKLLLIIQKASISNYRCHAIKYSCPKKLVLKSFLDTILQSRSLCIVGRYEL